MTALPLPLPATRAAAVARLQSFVPRAGLPYAARRNEDLPGHPHVSGLSPYLRHRLLTEAEVIDATLRAHPQGADKFLAEVWWRTYWKGWLERRPAIWSAYRQGLTEAMNRLHAEGGLRDRWEAACTGRTGIDGFDHWAQELAATGYLHNHARMWFASIWIFTLRLPWELGADFFLRHLIDGDPASNTLSWRWVGGLHTAGKTYAATPDNIAKNTAGRFRPAGLARDCAPLPMQPHPAPRPVPLTDTLHDAPTALLLHEDDLAGDGFPHLSPDTPLLFLTTTPRRPSFLCSTSAPTANGIRRRDTGSVSSSLRSSRPHRSMPMSAKSNRRRHSLPGYNLVPRPTACVHSTRLCVGRAIRIVLILGSSYPTSNRSALVSSRVVPSWNRASFSLRSGSSPHTASAAMPRSFARSARWTACWIPAQNASVVSPAK